MGTVFVAFQETLSMQSKLYSFSFIALLVLSLSSCKKWLPENRIEGSWRLTEVEKRRAFGNERINSGYESGVFRFNENGTASYTNATDTMQGNWQMRTQNGPGYYDSDGNWQTDSRQVLIIKLYDFNSNRVIDWYFDHFDFRSSGRRLFAFIESPSYNYRYCFSKQ